MVDEEIASLEIAGFFKTNDINKLLASLEQSFDIDTVQEGQTIHLRLR